MLLEQAPQARSGPQRVHPAQRNGGGIANRNLARRSRPLGQPRIVRHLRIDDLALGEDLDLMGAAAEEFGQDSHFGSGAKAEIASNWPTLAERRSLVRCNKSDSHSTDRKSTRLNSSHSQI